MHRKRFRQSQEVRGLQQSSTLDDQPLSALGVDISALQSVLFHAARSRSASLESPSACAGATCKPAVRVWRIGSRTVNSVPRPTLLATTIWPPCLCVAHKIEIARF